MADDNKAEVVIGAQIDEATAAIADLKSKFEGFAKDTQAHFDSLAQAGEKLLEKIKSLAEAFLGFEAIKHSVEVTKELGIEAEKVSERLGISQSAATQFAVAIDDIHGSVEQFLGIMQRQNRQLKSNEDGINSLGVKTRDASGNFLSQQEILVNSIETLKEYEAGTDRNRAAMVIFGGRVGDLTAIMKYNNEVQEEAKKKADALGLTMTKQGQETVKHYRDSMNEVEDVMKALQKVIGEAVMPILSDLGDWFAGAGKEAVDGFSLTVKVVASAFNGLVLVVQIVSEVIVGFVRGIAERLISLAEVAERAAHLDFSGAIDAYTAGTARMRAAGQKAFDNILDDAQKTKKRLDDLWNPDKSETGKPKGGNKKFVDPTTNAERAAAIDAQIAMAKKGLEIETEFLKGEAEAKRINEDQKVEMTRIAANSVYEYERVLLQKKVALYRAGTKEYQAALVAVDMLDAQHGLDNVKKNVELEGAQRKMYAERVALESDAIKARIALTGEGQKLESLYLDQQVQMGVITAEKKLQIEREMLQRIYEANREEMQREADLYKDPTQLKERQKALEAIEKLTASHNLALQKNTNDTLTELGKRWTTVLGSITKAFETSVKGIIMGTTTLRQAMANIFQSIVAEFISMGVKMVEEWIIQEIKKTAATEVGVASRTAAEQAGSSQSILLWAFTAAKNILNTAWEAMAGAFKAMVGIPVIGPAIAPGVAAGVFATVAGFAGAVSAAGGYDIPQGVNPVVQAHAREMILPQRQADAVRQMAEGRGAGGGMTVNISAVDAAGVRRLFMDHGPALSDSIRRQARNFTPTVPK